MDNHFKNFYGNIQKSLNKVNDFKNEYEKDNTHTSNNVMIRPLMYDNIEDAQKKSFLKKSVDGNWYEPGNEVLESEQLGSVKEILKTCLKID